MILLLFQKNHMLLGHKQVSVADLIIKFDQCHIEDRELLARQFKFETKLEIVWVEPLIIFRDDSDALNIRFHYRNETSPELNIRSAERCSLLRKVFGEDCS